MSTIYKIMSRVKTINRMDRVVRTSKDPVTEMVMEERIDLGWFAGFEGSWECIGLGFEPPDLEVGEIVEINIKGLKRK